MNEPDLEAPHLAHTRAAVGLMRTVRDALQPMFDARGAVTREEFDRVIRLLETANDRTSSLFSPICRACVEHPVPAAARELSPDVEGRRRDFAARLLFAHVVDRVRESRDPITGELYPQVLGPALRDTLSGLFYEIEWRALNVDALTVFRMIGQVPDKQVRARVDEDDMIAIVAGSVFVRFALRFKQYALQRQAFTRRMNEMLRERRFAFTDGHFVEMFGAIIARLRHETAIEFRRARLDTRYGDGAAQGVLRVIEDHDRHLETLDHERRRVVDRLQPLGVSTRRMRL